MLIEFTFIANSSRPTSCAFSAILQNEIPCTEGFLNFSVIFRATSLSSVMVLLFSGNKYKILIYVLLSFITVWYAQCSKIHDSGNFKCFAI